MTITDLNGSAHFAYERTPPMLACISECIFEGMSNTAAKRFPVRFIEAVPVGADLSLVGWKFLHWLVTDVVERHGSTAVKSATVAAIDVLRRKAAGEEVSAIEASAAARVADAVADAVAYASDAAAYAAHAAAYAAGADYAARSADYAAVRAVAYNRQAEKLLELIAAA